MGSNPDRWLTNLVAVVIVGGWLAALVTGLVVSDYTPLGITTPLMVALAGYAFGIRIIQRQKDGNGEKGERT